MNLTTLTDEEFRDELRESLWDNEAWLAFEAEDVVDRARECLVELRASLDEQLIAYGTVDNQEWARRAGRFKARVDLRLGQTRRAIKEYNRLETATAEAYETKWSTLAFALAEALEDSDNNQALDEILLQDGFSARQWIPVRRAQQARKAVAA